MPSREDHIKKIYEARDKAIADLGGLPAEMHKNHIELLRMSQARTVLNNKIDVLSNAMKKIQQGVGIADKRANDLVKEVELLADAAVIDWVLKF